MPIQTVNEIHADNYAYEQAVENVQAYEHAITALKKEVDYVSKVLDNEVIQNSLKTAHETLTQLFDERGFDEDYHQLYGYNFLGMRRAVTRDLDKKISWYTGASGGLKDAMMATIDDNVDQLNRTKARLATLNSDRRTVSIKDTRKTLNPLPYIKTGSVKFYTNTEEEVPNTYYLKFTVINTYITTSEPFREGLGAPLYVEPFGDNPHILLPPMVMHICLKDKALAMHPVGTSNNTIRFSEGRIHPHYESGPCFGNMENLYNQAVESLDMKLIVSVVRTWLQTATIVDTWGRCFFGAFENIVCEILSAAGLPNRYVLMRHEDGEFYIHPNGGVSKHLIKLKEASHGVYDLYLDNEMVGRYDPHES